MPPTAESTIQLGPMQTRALVQKKSINADERTVDVVWSTGADVERYDWSTGERYIERLSMDPAHIRLDRLNAAGPVLDGHMGYSVRNQLGAIVEGTASVKAKQGRATLRFSRRPEVDGVWRDIEDDIVRSVSVGYDVHAYEERPGKAGGLKIRTAIDWEPYEVSMVPMPADIGASTRERPKLTHPCKVITRGAEPADPQESTTMPETRQPSEFLVENPEPAPAARTAAPAPAAPVEPNDRDLGAGQERERIQGIISAVRAARLPASFADTLIAEPGLTLVRAQARVFEEMARREPADAPRHTAGPSIQMGEDTTVHVRAGIENAILHRVAPSMFKLDDKGREYRGMTLLDVGKVYLAARGIRTTGFSKMEIAGLALGLNHRSGLHTTSDFANLLADVANKTLRRAYEEAPQTFQPIARRVTLPDFKPVNRLQLGEAPDLLEVDEHGEFKRGTIGEGKEAFQLTTYGRVFGISRKALVNDDTDAFSRIPMLFGRAARRLESQIVWQQITSNPTMGDGNALFSAAHANLQTDGDVISIASLSRARKAIRTQTALDGTTKLDLVPRYLIVPAELETLADQLTAQVTPAQGSQVNPFSGRLTVIVESRLDDNSTTAWYMAASPDQVDTLEYGYLEGEEGPMVESRVGFDVDGLEIKSRLDFAAKAIDWRGLHKDPGELAS